MSWTSRAICFRSLAIADSASSCRAADSASVSPRWRWSIEPANQPKIMPVPQITQPGLSPRALTISHVTENAVPATTDAIVVQRLPCEATHEIVTIARNSAPWSS